MGSIVQYTSPTMKTITVAERSRLSILEKQWGTGDRLYKLAAEHYGSSKYWWVIAWWNSYGVEADVANGALIRIPLDLTEALRVLGV